MPRPRPTPFSVRSDTKLDSVCSGLKINRDPALVSEFINSFISHSVYATMPKTAEEQLKSCKNGSTITLLKLILNHADALSAVMK